MPPYDNEAPANPFVKELPKWFGDVAMSGVRCGEFVNGIGTDTRLEMPVSCDCAGRLSDRERWRSDIVKADGRREEGDVSFRRRGG
jgi:hypothetical protein